MDQIVRINGNVFITLDGVTKPIGDWKTPDITYDQLRSRAWRYLHALEAGRRPSRTVREIATVPVLTRGGRQKSKPPAPVKYSSGVSSLFCEMTLGR